MELSHAYIQHPPLRFDIPGALGVMYDDGNKLLLVPAQGCIYSWPAAHHPPESKPAVTKVKEGPVLAVRFALDRKFVSIQRSDYEMEIIDLERNYAFRQRCKQKGERILGFFWSDSPVADLVFVTSGGLEMYAILQSRKGLRLMEVRRQDVSWYVYTHESRMVLLASGMQCKSLAGFQFSAGGLVRLPKFEVTITREGANRKPVLAPEDVRIATMYGRLYCLQTDRAARQLRMYRFYRDAVVPQTSLSLYSTEVAINVVDSTLVIHNTDSGVVLLFDVLSDVSQPLASPLPLTLRGAPSDEKALAPHEKELYGAGWVYLNPDLILDHKHGLLWKVRLDLEAIAASCSDPSALVGFLQRRRAEPQVGRRLTIAALQSMLAERSPLHAVGAALDVVALACASAMKVTSQALSAPSPGPSARITPAHLRLAHARPLGAPPANEATTSAQPVGEHVAASELPRLLSSGFAGPPPQREEEKPPELREGSSTTGVDKGETGEREKGGGKSGYLEGREDGGGNGRAEEDGASGGEGAEEKGRKPSAEAKGKGKVELGASPGPLSEPSQNRRWPTDRPKLSLGEIRPDDPEPSASRPSSSGRVVPPGGPPSLQNSPVWRVLSPVVPPDEVFSQVLRDAPREGSPGALYLAAVLIEHIRSLAAVDLRTPPEVYELLIRLLLQEGRAGQLTALLESKVIEPSVAVAQQLLGEAVDQPDVRSIGLSMLRTLKAHREYVDALLAFGNLTEAMRYVRHQQVEDVIPPASFLERAVTLGNKQLLAAVYRFCVDSIPGFANSPDQRLYLPVLQQQVAAGGEGAPW